MTVALFFHPHIFNILGISIEENYPDYYIFDNNIKNLSEETSNQIKYLRASYVNRQSNLKAEGQAIPLT